MTRATDRAKAVAAGASTQTGQQQPQQPQRATSSSAAAEQIAATAAAAADASAASLAELALSSQPLTSSTSLLQLLAPDVQSYILKHGRGGGSGGGGSGTAAGAAFTGASAMRVATTVPGGGSAEDAPSAAGVTPAFGRRRHRASAASIVSSSQSPPRHAPPSSSSSYASLSRGRRRTTVDPLIGPVAALANSYLDAAHAQQSMDWKSAEAMPAPHTALVPTAAAINAALQAHANSPRGQAAAAAAAAAAATPASANAASTTSLYEGGPRLFNSQSKELLLAGVDGSQTARAASAAEEGSLHPPAAVPSARGHKSAQNSRSYNGLNGLSYSLTSPSASQSSLFSFTGAAHSSSHAPAVHLASSSSLAADAPQKFLLPPHNVLDINDGYSGAVDRWPAGYSDRRSTQAAKAALQGGGSGAAGSTQALREYEESLLGSKPSLLSELESFVSRELRSQGLLDRAPPSLARLSIYREALLKFAAGFNTYRPLLGRIQREYDEFLREQDRALSAVPELRRQVATMEAKVAEQREVERQAQARKDEQAAQEQVQLRAEIDRVLQEKTEVAAEAAERRKELAAVSAQLHSLNESHVTLKSALARASAERASALESWMSEAELARRLGVKVADQQKQQEALLHELSLLRSHASAQAAATPAHLQPVLDELSATKSSLGLAEARLQSRSAEYFALLNLYESLVAERAAMAEERQKYEELKRCSTPRPEWHRLLSQHYLPPTASLAIQSSESLLDEMCGEIDRLRASLHAWELKYPNADEVAEMESKLKDDGVKKAAAPLLPVRGSGPDVPLFLRTGKPGGKIRNKNISKRDVEILLKECWAMKLHTPDSEGGAEFRQMSLESFLYHFLKTKFGFHEAITAYGYSLLDALDRFRFDGDCELFLSILQGQLSEAVYVDQFQMLDALKMRLQDADVAYHKGRIKGRLPRKVLIDTLTRFFLPAKTESSFKKINHALFLSDRAETLGYPALFQEDREGNQSAFLECIRDQHLSEISEFMEMIRAKLLEKAKRYPAADGSGSAMLRLTQIREVLTMCDPAKSQLEIEMYLRAGRGLPVNQSAVNALVAQEKAATDAIAAAAAATGKPAAAPPSPTKPVPNPEEDAILLDPELFFKNLSRLLIKRTGPPPVDLSAELNRRGSLIYAASISGPGGARASLSSPSSLDLPHRRTSANGTSGATTPGSDDGGADEEEKREGGPRAPASSHRPALTRGGSIVDANTPSKPQQPQLTTPPLSGRTPFSPLAKRLSSMNLANVVLAARQQSLLNSGGGGAGTAQTPAAAAATSATAAPASQPSSPTVLASPPLSPASSLASTSASARAAASAASLDRLTTFVLQRAERQREEALAEELAIAAAKGDSASSLLARSASSSQLGAAGARPKAQVLQLQREGENFAAERAEIEIERQASLASAGEGERTPEEAGTPRLSTPPDQLTSLLQRSAAMHSPSSSSSAQHGSARSFTFVSAAKSPRAGAPTAVGDGSMSTAGRAGSTAAASAAATAAASPSGRSPGKRANVGFIDPHAPPHQPPQPSQQQHPSSGSSESVVSPVFSPVSTTIIQTRKQLRQSLRKSGGLASLLATQRIEDPSAADPDLDVVSRRHVKEQSL